MDRRTIGVLCRREPFLFRVLIMQLTSLLLIIFTNSLTSLGSDFSVVGVSGKTVDIGAHNESKRAEAGSQQTYRLNKSINVSSDEGAQKAVLQVVGERALEAGAPEPEGRDLIRLPRINRNDDSESFSDADHLGEDFMDLFDDLWHIKNNTAELIKQLNQAKAKGDDKEQNKTETNRTTINNRYQQNQQSPTGQSMNGMPFNINTNTNLNRDRNRNRNRNQLTHRLGPYVVPTRDGQPQNLRQPMQFPVMNNWFIDPVRAKINKIYELFSGPPTARFHVIDSVRNANRGPAQTLTNSRRNLAPPGGQRPNRLKRQAGNCIPMNNERVEQCSKSEEFIVKMTAQGFPGTHDAIETSCRHVAYLLINCWPDLRRQLYMVSTMSLKSVSPEEFLRTGSKDSTISRKNHKLSEQSCDMESQLNSTVRLRAGWLWLNLCIDLKFRNNYLENHSCLSRWTQERAQVLCTDEYTAIQAYSASQSEQSHRREAREVGTPPSIKTTELEKLERATSDLSANNTSQDGVLTKSERSEPNAEEQVTKMLCCVFDNFLRCVYRQALSDCAYKGAQFVVDFMARTGLDDLKQTCNSEVRSSNPKKSNNLQTSTTHSNTINNSLGIGTFIESDYCEDPKIKFASTYTSLNLKDIKAAKLGKGRSRFGSSQDQYGGRYGTFSDNGCVRTSIASMKMALISSLAAGLSTIVKQLYSPLKIIAS